MLVPQKKWLVPLLTGVYSIVRVPWNFDQHSFNVLFLTLIYKLPLHFLSRLLFRKLKYSSTKWQSPAENCRVEQNNQSFLARWNDFPLSVGHLLRLLDICLLICKPLSLFHNSTAPFGRPSASFKNSFILSLRLTMPAVSLSVVSKTQHQKTLSLNAGALSLWPSLHQ